MPRYASDPLSDSDSPIKTTVKPPQGSSAAASDDPDGQPLWGTALVRSGSGHVLIRTYAYPEMYVPVPRDLKKPRIAHKGNYYCVLVSQQCGIFNNWYVIPHLFFPSTT